VLVRAARLRLFSAVASRITVTVKPNAKKAEIVELGANRYRACVREPARDGKANRALIDLLAAHFRLPKRSIEIVHGQSGRQKVVDIG